MKTLLGFQRFSVSKILQASSHGGVVAKSERFEVWAHKYRAGNKRERHTAIGFSVCEVLSMEPRKVRNVELPDTCRSNLEQIIAHLSTVQS